MLKSILTIGGTGTLGQPVSRSLKEAGFHVRVLTRDHQKARKIFDSSFEIVVGDPMDESNLNEALRGCSGVHISLPNDVEQQVTETVAEVASRHGVERISYISGATVGEENRWFPMIDRKFLAEDAIRKTGISFAIFCPTWVMESLPLFVRQGRATVLGKQLCPYHWVAADDIARMVSASYKLGGVGNGRFLVFGPEAISMHEALRRYCVAFHPEIKNVSSTPFWLLKTLAAITGNSELKNAVEMMAYFETVGEGTNPRIDNSVLGAPATTLDTWLEKRKSRKRSLPQILG